MANGDAATVNDRKRYREKQQKKTHEKIGHCELFCTKGKIRKRKKKSDCVHVTVDCMQHVFFFPMNHSRCTNLKYPHVRRILLNVIVESW